jgi:hypothetical protein
MKKIVLDSDKELSCVWCNKAIEPQEPKIIYGIGSVLYSLAYHVDCERSARIAHENPHNVLYLQRCFAKQ